jgi:3'-5' exoribonuclease
MEDFCRAPAAQSFHHAFIGGLLEHTLNAVEVADACVKFYPGLNRDLILTGLFLHDIAKTWELQYQTCFGYSDGGHLVGHIVKSAIWVEGKSKAAEEMLGEKIPRPLIDSLQHIILSHHEKPEFGAARVPMTPEAVFVSMIDNLDAKMMIVLQACRGEFGGKDASDGAWTEYMKAMNGRLYRPDVAPAEVTDAVEPESTSAAPTLKLALNNPMFESSPPKNKTP